MTLIPDLGNDNYCKITPTVELRYNGHGFIAYLRLERTATYGPAWYATALDVFGYNAVNFTDLLNIRHNGVVLYFKECFSAAPLRLTVGRTADAILL